VKGGCPASADPARLGALTLEPLQNPPDPGDFSRLCALLSACVRSGASIGFVEPLAPGDVEAYWRRACGEAAAGGRLILVARERADGAIAGSAQLLLETRANGRHRAEVQKVMVFPELRRRGIAAALMSALESAARERGVSLLFLDTSEGRGGAAAFYAALGYHYAGGIPGYALEPDGTPAKNAIYYKALN
jgi:ribosomal protein S18 acetylase RimI-like enzyme